jgi:DNA-binding FadR family transcriptional regulator
MLTVLTRISTAEAVVNAIRTQIATGVLGPGDQLPGERALRQQFGISRFSLREGLARLNALGMIRILHGKGAFVCEDLNPTSLQNVFVPLLASRNHRTLRDLFDARVVIEREIAVRAAANRTTVDVSDLLAILDESDNALKDPVRFGELDFLFHRRIARIGRNVFFEKMADVLNEQVRLFLLDHARDRSSRDKALSGHHRIVDMIRERDVKRIGEFMVDHIRGCKKNYERIAGMAKGRTQNRREA